MMAFVYQYRWRIALLTAIWLIFECEISWFAFCDPTHGINNDCCAFKGPLISLSRAFLIAFGHFVKGEHDAIIALGTLIIGLFTYTLWRSTFNLTKIGLEEIRLARDEFLSSHRPIIRIKHVQMTSKLWEGEKLVFRIVFVNAGSSDAFVHKYGIGIHIIRPESYLPVDPQFPVTMAGGQQKCPVGFTLVAEGLTDDTVLTDNQNVMIRNRTRLLYCTGFVEYTDAQGWIRKTAFCRVFEASLAPGSAENPGRFVMPKLSDEPDYEYSD
jgi:hypothetical protein